MLSYLEPNPCLFMKMSTAMVSTLYPMISDFAKNKKTECIILDLYNNYFGRGDKLYQPLHMFEIKFLLEDEIHKRLQEGKIILKDVK